MNLNRFKTNPANASGESMTKYIGTSILIASIAFVLAAILHGAAGSDRSGEGMVALGLTIFGAPLMVGAGALSFVFRRTVIGEFFGGICLFGAVFFGTLFATG